MLRAHGLRGEVLVDLVSDDHRRLSVGSVLQSDSGEVTVRAARPHGRRWLVSFDRVDGRDAAEKLRGLVLYAEADPDAEGLWAHQIIGLDVVDAAGNPRGAIVEVQSNPAHDLLVLADGTLVPAVFITDVGERVVVDVPEGLF